jgi:ATP-dependent Lhr-like helicase
MTSEQWFASRGWQPHPFQRAVWAALGHGQSGLLHATTGSGKTYAVWLGALERAHRLDAQAPSRSAPRSTGPQVLWITPMRALASDTARALQQPLADMAPGWRVGVRTGDTPSAERAAQERRWPQGLVTTPESLSLMLTRADAQALLSGVHTVVVDEWHELIGNKRGVQVQLALARIGRWNRKLAVWGLSATLGNLAEAMAALLGTAVGRAGGEGDGDGDDTDRTAARHGVLVQGRLDKTLVIDTLLPREPGRFSWGGHLGAQMLLPVVDEIARCDERDATLVFTNVRSQAEIWYQLILEQRPDWAGLVALHHGSLDKATRDWVEAGLKGGSLKAVVATSSLDLGVDFLPVARVLQIGSAKGVARLLQRAGRSGHAPGRESRATLVPTNTLELVEAGAARRAALAGQVESRTSPDKPLDVLVQHLVTVALGGGFDADALFDEVRTAWAYRGLTREEFDWTLAFVERGGQSLAAYPEYHRVRFDAEARLWRVPDRGVAQRHRLSIGTITSDATMQVKWLTGGLLGTIEEAFISRLKAGDHFVFGGRVLEYVRTRDMAAYVRKATKAKGVVPTWMGSKMPLSSELAHAVLALLDDAADGRFEGPEMQAAMPMLQTQARLSHLPGSRALLVERWRSREGNHVFLYPFAGRNVHIGLAQLLAWRMSREQPNTFSISINDYGFEILGARPFDFALVERRDLFATDTLLHDVLGSLNSGVLAQRRFREIARVAGLVFPGYPGAPKSLRQVQASSSLFYEVFRKYDAGNKLLGQAEHEVLSQELEIGRLRTALERMAALPLDVIDLAAPSPFALQLMVERFREKLSTEQLKDRLDRLIADAEAALARQDASATAAASRALRRPRRRA